MRSMWAAVVVAASLLSITGQQGMGAQEPSGTVGVECPSGSDPGGPGPTDQPKPPPGNMKVVFDQPRHRIVAFLSELAGETLDTWAFDVCTNTWTQLGLQGETPAGNVHVALVPDRGIVVALAMGSNHGINTFETWTYDLAAERWAKRGDVPWVAGIEQPLFDPSSGSIAALDTPEEGEAGTEVWSYDLDQGDWQATLTSGDDPAAEIDISALQVSTGDGITVYDAATGRTWRLDLASATWAAGASGPTVESEWGWGWAAPTLTAAEETTGRMMVLVPEGVFAYDAEADVWDGPLVAPTDEAPGSASVWPVEPRSMVFDALNERLVVIGGERPWRVPGWQEVGGVWALDPVAGGWVELLAPTQACEEPVEFGDAGADRAPLPSLDPALVSDADGFVFEDVGDGVRRLVSDGAGHFPSATYIKEARDIDVLGVQDDGSVVVWSTTHGVDNDLGGNQEVWVLGVPGARSTCEAPSPMEVSRSDTWTMPDGTTWSIDRGELLRAGDGSVQQYLSGEPVNSLAVTPDGRAWVALGHGPGKAGGIYVIEANQADGS